MNYYILVEEYLYPTESGREVSTDTYDKSIDRNFDETKLALDKAFEFCNAEKDNFFEVTGCDYLPPTQYKRDNGEIGVIISPSNGLEPWYYAIRIIPLITLDKTLLHILEDMI